MQVIKPVTKPTKQRKMLFQAPDHIRYKLFAAPVSPELRVSHKVKTLPLRSGDIVRIMRGDHKGFEGKITRVDRKEYRVYVEGLTRTKVDGTAIFVPIHPSKVMITRLNLDDKWRKKILERKKGAAEKLEEVAEKPPERVEEIREEAIEEKVEAKEKLPEKKPRRRKRKAARKPAKEKERVEQEKPKAKKTRAKRKVTQKTEGGL